MPTDKEDAETKPKPEFSQDLSRFKSSLQYQCSILPKQALEDFEFLRQFDKRYEFVGGLSICLILIGVIGGIAGIILFNQDYGPVGIGALVTSVVILLIGGGLRFSFSRLNLEDRRYELAAGVIDFIRRDLHPESKVEIDIDFSHHNHERNFVRAGRVRQWNVKYYSNTWLILKGRLLDGNHFKLVVIEKQQDRSCKKRSRSGKVKHKSKTKNSSELICAIKPKVKNYRFTKGLVGQLKKNTRLPKWVHLKSIRVSKGVINIRSNTTIPWDVSRGQEKQQRDGVQWSVMSLLAIYRTLNALKTR